MQIRPGRSNGSRPDRRRLRVLLRPGAETETETGGPCPGLGRPPPPHRRSRHGQGRGVGMGWGAGPQPPWLSADPEKRRWAASCGSSAAPSRFPWLPAACFCLLRKPHGSCGSSVAPGNALRFPPAPAEAVGGLLRVISRDELLVS